VLLSRYDDCDILNPDLFQFFSNCWWRMMCSSNSGIQFNVQLRTHALIPHTKGYRIDFCSTERSFSAGGAPNLMVGNWL
jgi:hypothetical protein